MRQMRLLGFPKIGQILSLLVCEEAHGNRLKFTETVCLVYTFFILNKSVHLVLIHF